MLNIEKQWCVRLNVNNLSLAVLSISEGFCGTPGKSEMMQKGWVGGYRNLKGKGL